MQLCIRPVVSTDIGALAKIHATSWRSAYRGILRDEFLDSDLESNRTVLWTKRLKPLPKQHFGYLALENKQPVGFSFAFVGHDSRWGTQVDNLHVVPRLKGQGIGSQLLAALCMQAHATDAELGIYLWVYEANLTARSYYERLGAKPVERAVISPPGGGEAPEWRYTWPNSATLLAALKRDA